MSKWPFQNLNRENLSLEEGYHETHETETASFDRSGVSGVNNATTGGIGVSGVANATSANSYGVSGTIASTSGAGVLASATATSGYTNGVFASDASTQGAGVSGGASATSGGATGVFGSSAGADGGIGVWGSNVSTSGTGVGVRGDIEASAASGTAGLFINWPGQGLVLEGHAGANYNQVFTVDTSGNLDISGNITVAGKKSARVKLPDGREVALYAVESPENWFEDFGTGHLTGGVAQVTLDPEFLQTVDTAADYHVFLTPRGDCHGLYVASTTPTGFQVRELGGGDASIAFDYRIVAKRRGFETVRLEEVHVPQGPKDMSARVAGMWAHEHMALPPARPPLPVPQPPKIMIPPVPHPDGSAH
jgi:hypothetical protein